MNLFIKKSIWTTLLLALFFFPASAQTASTITGKWRASDNANRQCEIYLANDGLYYGKLIFEGGNKENLGKLLLKKLKFDEGTKTFKGTMSPPDRDMQINVVIRFLGSDELKIQAKKMLFSKTINFIRLK